MNWNVINLSLLITAYWTWINYRVYIPSVYFYVTCYFWVVMENLNARISNNFTSTRKHTYSILFVTYNLISSNNIKPCFYSLLLLYHFLKLLCLINSSNIYAVKKNKWKISDSSLFNYNIYIPEVKTIYFSIQYSTLKCFALL